MPSFLMVGFQMAFKNGTHSSLEPYSTIQNQKVFTIWAPSIFQWLKLMNVQFSSCNLTTRLIEWSNQSRDHTVVQFFEPLLKNWTKKAQISHKPDPCARFWTGMSGCHFSYLDYTRWLTAKFKGALPANSCGYIVSNWKR